MAVVNPLVKVLDRLKQLPSEELTNVATKATAEGDEVTANLVSAVQQGYTNLYYHGSKADITEFTPSKSGTLGPGVYLESDPAKASGYALRDSGSKASLDNAAVYPVLVRGEPDKSFASEVVVSDPSRIRSINAKFDEVNKRSKNILAGGLGGALLLPEDSEANEDSLSFKVNKAISDGVAPSQLVAALKEAGYDAPIIEKVLAPHIAPKLEQMRADGVPDEAIVETLVSAGILSELPTSSASDYISSVIGMQGPDKMDATTEATGDQGQEFSPLLQVESEGLVKRESPIAGLDPNAPAVPKAKPIIDKIQSPEDTANQLRNLHMTYEQLANEVVGWSGLAPEMKAKGEQLKQEANTLITKGLEERGYKVVGIDQYGDITILDPQTGEPLLLEDSILASLANSKYEIGGGIVGAVATGTAAGTIGGPLGMIGGALLGGAVFSALGRGADVITDARDLNYELSTTELLAKMNDAGIADATLGVLGASAFQVVKGTWKLGKAGGRGLARSWDLFVSGNRQGAIDTLKASLNVNDTQAIALVEKWEVLNNTKVLTEEARATGALTRKDIDPVMAILAQANPNATDLVAAAAKQSKTAGSKLAAQINERAAEITKLADNITSQNVDTVLQDELGKYVKQTGETFESVKQLGTDLMKDTGYRFQYDTTTLVKQLKEMNRGITNWKAYGADFNSYIDEIGRIGNVEAKKAIQAEAAASGEVAKVTKAALEASNPYRTFGDLLALRMKVNQLRSETRFSSFVDFKKMETAMQGIDAEIARAAEQMPSGDKWLAQWKAANMEYHKMKQVEDNVLFKALVNPNLNKDETVKKIMKSMSYKDPSTFMSVMGKLPEQTRKSVEGAVLRQVIETHTVGMEGGTKAINFVKLSQGLDKLAFTQTEARDLKRVINQFAEVYRTDPHLAVATGNIPLPKFQSYLTADPVVRVKYEFASYMFNAVKAKLPFSDTAGRAALLNNLTRLLDNPLDAASSKAVLAQLPNDPELKTALHKLAMEYAKTGKPENYGKVPIYRVAKPGEFNKAGNTSIGQGVLYYTDKAKAQSIAKQTGTKVKEVQQLHRRIATPETIQKLIGREPTPQDFRDPEILQLLRGDYAGLAVEDKVILFK